MALQNTLMSGEGSFSGRMGIEIAGGDFSGHQAFMNMAGGQLSHADRAVLSAAGQQQRGSGLSI